MRKSWPLGWVCCRLLGDMGQLMGQQPPARRRSWFELAGTEDNVVAHREGLGLDRLCLDLRHYPPSEGGRG